MWTSGVEVKLEPVIVQHYLKGNLTSWEGPDGDERQQQAVDNLNPHK